MSKDMGKLFRALHNGSQPFIIPNPWDAGSARLLEAKGFKALASTSSGFVFALGRQEGSLKREEVLAHCQDIAGSVSIPVSADFEDGYAETIDEVYETFRRAGETGLAGASIEDASLAGGGAMYEFGPAVDRVRAAVEAVRSLNGDFVLTARCENYICGRTDLADAIARLQAYQEAGADVLFAPGMTSLDDIRTLVASVDRPVNVNIGLKDTQFTLDELAQAGVKRISVGSALFRSAYGAVLAAVDEMLEEGSFDFARTAAPFSEFNAIFAR